MNEFKTDEFKNLTAGPVDPEENNTIVKVIEPHPITRNSGRIRNFSTLS